jgi:hypothetical protein
MTSQGSPTDCVDKGRLSVLNGMNTSVMGMNNRFEEENSVHREIP